MRRTLILFIAAVAALAVLVPATGSARTQPRPSASADRNHDRIPDRWERRHRLSLRVKQTRRDQDRDGLNNLGEFKAGTNPRDRDTDDDGLRDGAERRLGDNPRDRDSDDDGREDGDENAGRVASFDGTTLTIALASGGTVTGTVDDSTEIECKRPATNPAPTATSSREDEPGDDDNSGPGSGDDDNSGPGGDDDPGDDDHGDDGDDDDEVACAKSDLTAGTVVHEAELRLGGGSPVFREVELVK